MKYLYLLTILIVHGGCVKQISQDIKFDKVELKRDIPYQQKQLEQASHFSRFYQINNKQTDEFQQFELALKNMQKMEQLKKKEDVQLDFIKQLKIPVSLNVVSNQIDLSLQLVDKLYEQIHNQQNLYDFAFKVQKLAQLVNSLKTQLYQNVKTNQQIMVDLVQSDLKLRRLLFKMDNGDLQLQKLNNNVVGLEKSQKQIEILENIERLQQNNVFSQNLDYSALKLYVNNYCGLTSIYNRLSHQINIRIEDPTIIQIQKLIQSPLYCLYQSDEGSYQNIVKQQNWSLYKQYRQFLDLNQNCKESIEQFNQNNQVDQQLWGLENEEFKKEMINDIAKEIEVFLNIQEKEVDQNVNVGQNISDEEEEYIKANKIYDQNQFQKEQKQIELQKNNDQQSMVGQIDQQSMVGQINPSQILLKLKQKELETLKQLQYQNNQIVVTKQNSGMIQKMKDQSIELQKMLDQNDNRK